MTRQGRRVALLSLSPDIAQSGCPTHFPSYGIRRIHAAVVADPELADADVLMIDERKTSAEAVASRLLAFEPDVLGLSVYVWSTELMAEVARMVKQERPQCAVIIGGPSARPAMFDIKPFADYRDVIDAMVVSDGEEIFRDIVALGDRSRASLAEVAGLVLPGRLGWMRTAERTVSEDMDMIASPFQLGLMSRQDTAYVETFRGCPLSCAFCQWGVMDSKRKFSTAYLVRELQAMKDCEPALTFLVDAALNLNAAAFRNLAEAEKEVGFFRDYPLLCEVYPTLLKQEHLDFLENCRYVHIGLGVQSLDSTALDANQRPFKPERLRRVVEQLSAYGLVDVEVILGLPGDTPETFRRTLDEVLALPCNVRVYKCLVLPDALMTRAPQAYDIRFDPLSLRMTSCYTWSEKQLADAQDHLRLLAETIPFSEEGDYFWHFTGQVAKYQQAYAVANQAAGDTGGAAL